MAKIDEEVSTGALGEDLFIRNLRKVLVQKGYTGDALEQRISVVLARDPSRLASVFSADAKAEAKAVGAAATAAARMKK